MLFAADVNIGAHYRSVLLWPLPPLPPSHTVKHELICYYHCLRLCRGGSASAITCLTAVGVNELVSMFGWTSLHFSVLTPFLLPLFPYENAIRGTCLRGCKSEKSSNNSERTGIKSWASAWVSEEAMMETVEMVSERNPSRLSCDWSLCCCICDVGASSLMFCAKLLEVLACCLTPNLLMYIFTYLSKNLWSWGESCLNRNLLKKKQKKNLNLVGLTFDISLKRSLVQWTRVVFWTVLFCSLHTCWYSGAA